MTRLDWTFLGRLAYGAALRVQYHHAREVAAGAGPVLFLVEHPHTITLGRHAQTAHLKLPEEEFSRRGFSVHRVLRGGDVTYHGPGQLVGYPVASLGSAGCSVPEWVGGHARAIVRFLARHRIAAEWSQGSPGVWVGKAKIAALGFHIRKGVSTHGFALNLHPDLSCFETIVPCGLENRGVTSMRALGARVPLMQEAAAELAGLVAAIFGWSLGRCLRADTVLDAIANGKHVPAVG